MAVDGACLTVTAVDAEAFAVDVIGTTLDRTIAVGYADGTVVNLERALSVGARLDGHLVQGHVDAVGRLERSMKDGEYWLMDFRIPAEVHAQTLQHGSITLNGVSLTPRPARPVKVDSFAPSVCRSTVSPSSTAPSRSTVSASR